MIQFIPILEVDISALLEQQSQPLARDVFRLSGMSALDSKMQGWITFSLIEMQRTVGRIAVLFFVERIVVRELKFERIKSNFIFAFNSKTKLNL